MSYRRRTRKPARTRLPNEDCGNIPDLPGIPRVVSERHAELIAGALYRDMDGTVVHLLAVDRDLCSWVPLSSQVAPVQVTHAENFRLRFRRWYELEPLPPKGRTSA